MAERVCRIAASLKGAPPIQRKRRVGVLGYGTIGQYLVRSILTDASVAQELELAFVWNRSPSKMADLPKEVQLANLSDFHTKGADLIIEVAHPSICERFGAQILNHADLMIGSPAAMASKSMEKILKAASNAASGHGLYVPSGALWGATDIQKMADRGLLASLFISMSFHPASVKALGSLKKKIDALPLDTAGPVVVYAGPVRPLCALAPNNVNTMAAAALAAHTLGFDQVQAKLIVDSTLDAHVITVNAIGHPRPSGQRFEVSSTRSNPAQHGAVTGSATYVSFVSSMLRARGKGKGIHFC